MYKLLGLLLMSACSAKPDTTDSSSPDTTNPNPGTGTGTDTGIGATTTAPDWSTCTVLLSPGSADDRAAVQTAFIKAGEGDELCLDEGNWSFDSELSLSVNGVILRGAGGGRTVLDFSTQDLGSNGISITGDDVTVEDLTMMNTPGDGIRASSVDGITYRRVTVGWDAEASTDNGAYGLYPVGCTRVRIEDCEVFGARDAGIYVGQSETILVVDSYAHDNVAGIEIENSTDAEITGCTATNNTGGILIFNLPGLPVQDGKRAKVHDNTVTDNNRTNFAETGTTVASVPAGIGVMVMAADDNEVHDNIITGNGSTGVLVISYISALMGAWDDKSFNAFPQGNWVHDNSFSDNGGDPDTLVDSILPKPRPLPAILWDGCLEEDDKGSELPANNCVDGDESSGWMSIGICGTQETNPTDMVCEGTALSSQNP